MMERFQQMLRYVEEHLDQEVDVQEASRYLLLAPDNFQKVFSVLTGRPFGEYVRRRKLSEAYKMLCDEPDRTVLEVALYYGYESADAFSRSFKRAFGTNPSFARKEQQLRQVYPPFQVSIQIEGGEVMKYQVKEKKACLAIGKMLTYRDEKQAQADIGNQWALFYQEDMEEQLQPLRSISDPDFYGTVGFCWQEASKPSESMRYLLGVLADEGTEVPDNWQGVAVPARTYLVFEVSVEDGNVGSSIQKAYRTIFGSFLPTSNYRFEGSDFEFYPDDDPTKEWNPQIWIPVVKE